MSPIYVDMSIPYPYALSYLDDFTHNIWGAVRYISDYVPGGRYYYLVAYKDEQLEDVKVWYKVFQSFANADRFEYAISLVLPDATWLNKDTGFHPGVGLNETDFIDKDGVRFDCKVYYNFNTLCSFAVDKFCYNTDWDKNIKKLFHNGEYLLAYDDEKKILYKITRPTHVLTKAEATATIKKLDLKVPNVIAKDGKYIVANNADFRLLFINEMNGKIRYYYR